MKERKGKKKWEKGKYWICTRRVEKKMKSRQSWKGKKTEEKRNKTKIFEDQTSMIGRKENDRKKREINILCLLFSCWDWESHLSFSFSFGVALLFSMHAFIHPFILRIRCLPDASIHPSIHAFLVCRDRWSFSLSSVVCFESVCPLLWCGGIHR